MARLSSEWTERKRERRRVAHELSGSARLRRLQGEARQEAQLPANEGVNAAVFVFSVGAFAALVPLWAPLVMAAWTANLAHPLHARAARRLGGSQRAAGVLTVGLVLLLVIPLTVLVASFATEAVSLVRRLMASKDGATSLLSAISADTGSAGSLSLPLGKLGPAQLMDFMKQHGTSTWRAFSTIAGATANALVGAFVFVIGMYVFLVSGKSIYKWLADHAPIPRDKFHRFAQAFNETGRGLFIGVGLTALAQGAVATIGYVALGLPQAAVLGGLTVIASLIPSGGAALVWAPVAVALAVTGRPGAATVMLIIGVVASTADNFVRPMLSRIGHLRLPTFLLLIAMLGGIVTFGAWGLVLGPLFVRLAVEGLKIIRERQEESDAVQRGAHATEGEQP
jgi:predicted PurR-regulated permease PerM